MSDPREREDARALVDAGVWHLTRLLEAAEADRNRWRGLAIGWARDTLAGAPISRRSAESALSAYEEVSRD